MAIVPVNDNNIMPSAARQVVLLDTSGSMNGPVDGQTILDKAIQSLRRNDVGECLGFNHSLRLIDLEQPIRAEGKTALYDAMRMAVAQHPEQELQLLVITDGEDNCRLDESQLEPVGSMAECFAWIAKHHPQVHITLALAVIGCNNGEHYARELQDSVKASNVSIGSLVVGDDQSIEQIVDATCAIRDDTTDKVRLYVKGKTIQPKSKALLHLQSECLQPVEAVTEFATCHCKNTNQQAVQSPLELCQFLLCFMLRDDGANGGVIWDWCRRQKHCFVQELKQKLKQDNIKHVSNSVLSQMHKAMPLIVDLQKAANGACVYTISANFKESLQEWVQRDCSEWWSLLEANPAKKRKQQQLAQVSKKQRA